MDLKRFMKAKPLPCQLCGKEVSIRSTIKEGEFKGKKACPFCASKHKEQKPYKFTAKKRTEKTSAMRSEERKDFPRFFVESIEELQRNPVCQNCGCRINASYNASWNIAHILSKRTYKSVSTHEENRLFLCSSKDESGNFCHEKFDSGLEERKSMPVFSLALQKFVKFKDECLERGKEYSIFEENI